MCYIHIYMLFQVPSSEQEKQKSLIGRYSSMHPTPAVGGHKTLVLMYIQPHILAIKKKSHEKRKVDLFSEYPS
ncbi:hypothetical protein C0J52_28144 [Blattella germanica]|nr:hypothetical protein C0J52_28144 [Blattella germanica]